MSKHIVIGKCRRCGKEVGRIEEGEIENYNGVKATNTETYYVSSCFCPSCKTRRKEKKNELRKSMCNI